MKFERNHKFKFNIEKFYKYLGIVVIIALAVMETIIAAQYVSAGTVEKPVWMYVMLAVCSVLLDVSVALKYYVIKPLRIKIITYGFDMVLMLTISLITASSFLVVLYCLVMTDLYLSSEDIKTNLILFITSICTFIIAFVCGWVRVYAGWPTYRAAIEILGSCLFSIIILVIHYVTLSFIARFYHINQRLNEALKAEEEGKRELEDAYNKLAEAAVFEERNRIAKDIHDNAGHSITAVIMQTEAAKLLVDTDPEEAKKRIISANMQAKNALDQMRTSVHILAGRRTAVSLGDEIAEIVAQTIDGTNIKIRSDVEEIIIDAERVRFICNSIKECLANGMRHGGATAFYIEVKKDGKNVNVLVSDNGRGHEGALTEGFGLGGMREKIASYGGTMQVVTDEDDGFEVNFTIPVTDPETDN